MTPCCPSCATVSATPALSLTEADRRDLLAELTHLRDRAGALDCRHASGRYELVVSLAQGERDAVQRREAWDRTGLGRLLGQLGGGQ